jgi:hypothetical protein
MGTPMREAPTGVLAKLLHLTWPRERNLHSLTTLMRHT